MKAPKISNHSRSCYCRNIRRWFKTFHFQWQPLASCCRQVKQISTII